MVKYFFRKGRLLSLSCLLILVSNCSLIAQSFGFEMPDKKKEETIPFEYINGFIIVEIYFNETFPLKFIFDTGAGNTIINNKEFVDLFGLPYGRTFTIYGADLSKPLYAHLVKSIHLSAGNLKAPNQNILVLEEDYFNFEHLTGIDVHGILGADMFKNYKVKINYQKKTINLSQNEVKRHITKGYNQLDMVVQKGKPYIKCETTLENKSSHDLKLLIDTGASTALLLNTDSDSTLRLPEQIIPGNLGFGVGGIIEGHVGRIPYFEIGEKTLENVVCHFQDNSMVLDSLNIIFRHGLVGNLILDRFEVIIDYPDSKLYLKPTRRWKRKFNYDKSGLGFISIGIRNNTYYITNVLAGSPASLGGLKTGDIIRKINGRPTSFLTYDAITRALRRKTGKKTTIKVQRGQQKMKFEFRLKDMI